MVATSQAFRKAIRNALRNALRKLFAWWRMAQSTSGARHRDSLQRALRRAYDVYAPLGHDSALAESWHCYKYVIINVMTPVQDPKQ